MAFDHDKIQTILVNLISNALKFTPEGGQVTLTLHTSPSNEVQHPEQVVLELSDTGLRRGADAYLAKPFNLEELLANLHMLVERQKRMLAHFSRSFQEMFGFPPSTKH